ncbi:MAG: FCD domain-containing protein [Litorimonas sp.]
MAEKDKISATEFAPVRANPIKTGGKIRVPKVAELVADTIRNRILSGELREGDSLPPEAQLLEAFGISRPTLREAFRVLETEKLLSVSRGSRTGATVHEPKIDGVARYASYVLRANNTTIADVYGARLAIEPFIVRRLAEKSPKETVERLRQEAKRLDVLNEAEKHEEVTIGLTEFHRVLVEVGGNKALHFLVELLNDIMKTHQLRHLSLRPFTSAEQRKRSQIGIKSFFRLVEYIEKGDVDAAEAHWRLHLEKTNKIWVADPKMLPEIR